MSLCIVHSFRRIVDEPLPMQICVLPSSPAMDAPRALVRTEAAARGAELPPDGHELHRESAAFHRKPAFDGQAAAIALEPRARQAA